MRLVSLLTTASLILSCGTSGVIAASPADSSLSGLEKRFTGRSYQSQTLDIRLDRLEKLVFGSVSDGTQTDRLNRLLAATSEAIDETPETSAPPVAPPRASRPAASNAPPVAPNLSPPSARDVEEQEKAADPYPRVGAMEEAILEHRYPAEDLPDRLARMERQVYGASRDNEELSDRTDNLQAYVEKKLHKKLFQENTTRTAAAGSATGNEAPRERGSKIPMIVNMVSQALFGTPGVGGMPYGPTMGGMGFGGVRLRNRADMEPQAVQTDERPRHPVDPVAFKSAPPPANAKLLTKLAWCEVQIFGHPFSDMHLTERLEQLNGELGYKPGLSGIQLMDHIDPLVAAVKSRAGKAIGSTAPAAL